MATPFPFDERLETAAQHLIRTRIFYDIWWFFVDTETRPAIEDAMNRYKAFFRLDPHAHFVSFIVHITELLETRRDTINLPNLAKELEDSGRMGTTTAAEVNALLQQADPLASRVRILRDNLFAHRSAYDEAFEKVAVTPDELHELTEIALKIVNQLRRSLGLNPHIFDWLPLSDAEEMLKALTEHALAHPDDG